MEPDEQTPDPPEMRIRGGASPEEVAAVVAALTQAEPAPQAGRATPPWLRAALREGAGERPAAAPQDLR